MVHIGFVTRELGDERLENEFEPRPIVVVSILLAAKLI